MKKIVRLYKRFWTWLKGLIRSFNTVRGLISLFISFMIFCGWALVFIGLGIAFKNAKLVAIGSSVIMFWSAPLTPMWGTIILVAVFIRKKILKDKGGEE